MNLRDLINAIGRMKVETGSLVCLGCGYENSCGTHGCAILRKAQQNLLLLSNAMNEETVLRFATEILDTTPEKLREAAQAEKEGRLFVLPRRPAMRSYSSNELFIIDDGEVLEDHLFEVEIGENSEGEVVAIYTTLDGNVFSEEDIGKTVFLNEEDAKKVCEEANP